MNIKKIIKESGWTLDKLAAEMMNKNGQKGISQPSLSQIINGNPTLDKLQEIARIIGVPLSRLVGDDSSVHGFVKVGNQIHEISSFDDLRNILKLEGE